MANQTNCAYQYTVKRGDSYYLIAQRLDVPLADLLNANEGIPPARLTVGDVLCIPETEGGKQPAQETPSTGGTTSSDTPGTTTPDTSGSAPTDPAGDTGSTADSGTGTGQTQTTELCPPTRRTVVQEGQTAGDLQVRYGLSYYTLQTANRTADLENLKAGDVLCVPSFNVPCPLPDTVTLGENDTLESVALQYNLPISSLLRANPCLSPADFVPGTQIKMPK